MTVAIRFPNLEQDFARIRLKHGGGVFASASPHYSEAIFGRDSIEVAEDLLPFKPEVAKEVLLTLASLQGQAYNPLTEEEPGKIHHEYRATVIDGREVSEHGKQRLKKLAAFWGGSEDRLLYYGSADATPLFVRLAVRYCQQEGVELLDQSIKKADGSMVTLRQAVRSALGWLEQKMSSSSAGLVEFCRMNSHGHSYQVWKDGSSAYLHSNGRRADFRRPIAAIEVQAYAYDALLGASELGPDLTRDQLLSHRWATMAEQLRDRTLRLFWLSEESFLAIAVDRDEFDQPRPVATRCSNAGLALESRIFDDLEAELKQQYVTGIVTGLYNPDFVTAVGIRCRSLAHEKLVNFADYHGAWAVWPKETYDIAKGLRRQGFEGLATQLELRIINGIRLSGTAAEFWYVDSAGRVNYDPFEKQPWSGSRRRLIGTHYAEETQAWTISAGLAIERQLSQPQLNATRPAWQEVLEGDLLQGLPEVVLLETEAQARKAYPTTYAWHIDQAEGRKRRLDLVDQPFA
jgi:glycogen debranching enzyme